MTNQNVCLEWGKKTYVMGILNVTPDSFSGDGLLEKTVDDALDQARQFVADGAHILDIGGESTRPGSEPVSAAEEMARVLPVIRALRAEMDVIISVDTYRAEVAEAALAAGADWINDVWGLRMDPDLAGVVAAADCPVVLMHNRSQPKNLAATEKLGGRFVGVEYDDLLAECRAELQECIDIALNAGVRPENIIIDPGIGFGKTTEQNLEIMDRLDEFRDLGYPILLGTSRKSFIGYTLDLPATERIEGTAASIAIGIDRGADIVRVHDVKEMARVAAMTDAMVRRNDDHTSSVLQQYNRLESHLNALLGEVTFDPTINLRLERIERLLTLLGNPHHAFRSIHVGGTSGKGSTAALIATGLQRLGYTTALHTSPHLQVLNETTLVNGRMAPTSKLLTLYETFILPAIAQMRAEAKRSSGDGAPSYFEALVALAFLHFAHEKVDVAVVEVGLGGRLDATNVLPAEVAVLTNVSLDHTAILGDTVEAITHEKAGIIKPEQQVILGTDDAVVNQVVAKRCTAVGASLQVVTLSAERLAQDARAINQASATAAISAFVGAELTDEVSATIFDHPIALPARTEIIARERVAAASNPANSNPADSNPVVLDGAHNPAKMAVADQFLRRHFPDRQRVVVAAMKLGKAVEEVLPIMLADARLFIASQFSEDGLWQAVPATELARLAREIAPSIEVIVEPDPLRAIAYANEQVRADELLWGTGSLYFAGEVREYWHPKAELLAAAEDE